MSEIRYKYRPFVFTGKSGNQILISVYVGDQVDEQGQPALKVTLATRQDRYKTWGAPIYFQAAP
jgi:hypothetical protein